MLRKSACLCFSLFLFSCGIKTVKNLPPDPALPTGLRTITLSLQSFTRLDTHENVECYAEVFLDKKKIGTTEQRLLSQAKTLSFATDFKKHTIRLRIFLQDPFRKHWKPLSARQQPPVYTLSPGDAPHFFLEISHHPLQHTYDFSYHTSRKSPLPALASQEVPLSIHLVPESFFPAYNPLAYVEIFLDHRKILTSEPEPLATPRTYHLPATAQRHHLQLAWYIWSEPSQRYVRLKNLFQPPPRSFTPELSHDQTPFPLRINFHFSPEGSFHYEFDDNFYE